MSHRPKRVRSNASDGINRSDPCGQPKRVDLLWDEQIAFPPHQGKKFYEDFRDDILGIFTKDYPGEHVAVGYGVEYNAVMDKDILQIKVVRAIF